MSGAEKAEVLDKVASSSLPKRRTLGELGVPRSTYYRWLRRKEQQGLEDDVGGGNPPWNKLTSQEIDSVLSAARDMPDLSCRQLAAWTTDNMGFSVSESTVYRILRREGLVKRPEMRLAAGKEYHRKTTGPHQMWATDASYFRVVGWGYYYMVTVMDDYSRFILAHKLQRDMTSDSFVPRQLFVPNSRRLVLPVHLLWLSPLLGCISPVAGDVKLEDDGVVHHPVDGRGGGHGVGKDTLPLGEDQV